MNRESVVAVMHGMELPYLMHKHLLLLLQHARLRVDGGEEAPALRHVEPLHATQLETCNLGGGETTSAARVHSMTQQFVCIHSIRAGIIVTLALNQVYENNLLGHSVIGQKMGSNTCWLAKLDIQRHGMASLHCGSQVRNCHVADRMKYFAELTVHFSSEKGRKS